MSLGRARWAVVGVAVAAVIGVAGCSSSGSGDQSSAGATSDTGAASAYVSYARTAVAQAQKDLMYFTSDQVTSATKPKPMTSWLGPTKPDPVVTGKRFVFISCGPTACTDAAQAGADVMTSLGNQATVLNKGGSGTVENLTNAFNSALALHPAGIVAVSLPTQLLGAQLRQAKSEGIVTVSVADEEPTGGSGEYDAAVRAPNIPDGLIAGLSAVSDSDGKANAIVIDDAEFPSIHGGALAEVAALKPCSGCKTTVVPWQISDALDPTKASSIITSALNSHPDANTILMPYENGIQSVVAAVRASGRKVKIYLADLDDLTGPMLKSDSISAVASSDWHLQGYQEADQLLRGLAKQPYVPDAQGPILVHLYTSANVPSDWTPNFQSIFDYHSVYKKLWTGGR